MNLYKNQLNRHTGSEIMSWILEVHLEDQLEGHLIIWNRWRRQLQLHSCRSRSSIGRSRWKAGNIRVVRRSSLKSVWPMLKVLTELIEPATLKLCGGRQRNQKIAAWELVRAEPKRAGNMRVERLTSLESVRLLWELTTMVQQKYWFGLSRRWPATLKLGGGRHSWSVGHRFYMFGGQPFRRRKSFVRTEPK